MKKKGRKRHFDSFRNVKKKTNEAKSKTVNYNLPLLAVKMPTAVFPSRRRPKRILQVFIFHGIKIRDAVMDEYVSL